MDGKKKIKETKRKKKYVYFELFFILLYLLFYVSLKLNESGHY